MFLSMAFGMALSAPIATAPWLSYRNAACILIGGAIAYPFIRHRFKPPVEKSANQAGDSDSP